MYKHPNSPEFIWYLKTVIPDLVKAIEDHLWTLWKAGDTTPNAYDFIPHDLWLVGGHFAFLNNTITERETAFIYDIQSFLGVDDFDEDSIQSIRKSMLMPHNIYLYEDFDSLEYPSTVNFIKPYKSNELKNLQTKSKEMLIRYANAVCLAENGKMSDIQTKSLLDYQAMLNENFKIMFDAKAKFERARALTRQAHGSQKYGDLPYEFHLPYARRHKANWHNGCGNI